MLILDSIICALVRWDRVAKQCKGLGDCGKKLYHEDASGGLLEPFSDEKRLCILVIFLMLLEDPGL